MQSKQLLETESKKVKYQSNSRSPSIKSQQIMDVEVGKLKEIDDQSLNIICTITSQVITMRKDKNLYIRHNLLMPKIKRFKPNGGKILSSRRSKKGKK